MKWEPNQWVSRNGDLAYEAEENQGGIFFLHRFRSLGPNLKDVKFLASFNTLAEAQAAAEADFAKPAAKKKAKG